MCRLHHRLVCQFKPGQQPVQVTRVHRNVLRGHLFPRRKMQLRGHLAEPDEVLVIVEGAGATAVHQILRVHHPPVWPKGDTVAANLHIMRRIAGAPGEAGRGTLDRFQQQPAINPDVFAGNIHLRPGPGPNRQHLVVQKIHPHVFQNMQRGIVNFLELVGIEKVERPLLIPHRAKFHLQQRQRQPLRPPFGSF